MLRAYRRVFMGTMDDRWKEIVDLGRGLRLPVALLIAALLWFGFYPQSLVRILSPVFETYLK
jgi:NADH:ubiquinone oxidoreductase subunit 4 (subunit M)